MGLTEEIIEYDESSIDYDTEIWWYDGDFDFGEYVLNGETGEVELIVDPDSVATEEDYDFEKAAYNINIDLDTEIWWYEGDFDFGEYDIDEETGDTKFIVDRDTVAIEQDYDYNKAAEEFTHPIIEFILDSILASTKEFSKVNLKAEEFDTVDEKYPMVSIQFLQYISTNKAFIEFRFNNNFSKTYKDYISQIVARIHKDIYTDMFSQLKIYPEVILIEDGKHENCDSSSIVTPFTIRQWLSLSGKYEFLRDKAKVFLDYNNEALPVMSEDYYTQKEQIYQQYYTSDFNKFTEEMCKLNSKQKYDLPPKKDFKDFVDQVKELALATKQVDLSESDKDQFIQKYMNILKTYRLNTQQLEIEFDNLCAEYGVKRVIQTHVPDIFEAYEPMYQEFFEESLTHVNDHILTKNFKITVA